MTKILVIDDDTTSRDKLVAWLNDEDYEATGISDSLTEVEFLLRNRADLIVYNIEKPLVEGYGVWLEVHAYLAAAKIPFVFITASASLEDNHLGMALSADIYISKPFGRQDLVEAIQSRLTNTAAQEQKLRRDVENLQVALAAEREDRMLSAKMIAMFSHDFRTPLTIILTASQLLRGYSDRMDAERRLIHAARIEAAGNQLLHMVEEMLLIAQMDAGKLDFSPEPLPIARFLARIVEEFKILHRTTHQIEFESHFKHTVQVDSRLLRQIAVNLISNAIKYSSLGSEVRIVLDGEERQHFSITVQDHGIGILEADQGRVFDAFERGANVGDKSGTGLGLAIVKQAVELHGGSVQLESQSGIGTTVRVTIPYH